ncbi:MAG: methionine--tRNA ligase subunit beta [Candidatus Aenigmatarchaeota archaeon]
MTEISFNDFQKVEMKVGKILEAREVPNSKKLIKLQVDFGNEKRQAVAGVLEYYKPEELVGKSFIFVTNLKPVKLMGVESNCMILAADDGKGKIVLIQPERDIETGSRVR